MDFRLTPEQTALQDEIVAFARERLSPEAGARDRERRFCRDLWRECAGQGLLGLVAPVEHGGRGLDPVSTVAALEALGYGCTDGGLAFSVGAHLLAGVVPLVRFGDGGQQARHLPGLGSGDRIAAHAMTEATSGSDAFRIATTAVPDGDGFHLSGTKRFVTNGPVADLCLVYATTDAAKGATGGITAFLVDKRAPGVRDGEVLDTVGLRTSPLGELVLDGVRVGAEAVLGGVGGGAGVFGHAMDWERTGMAALHAGTMRRLLERMVEQARRRESGGKPLGRHQAVSHRIADAKVRLEAARLLTYRAATRLGRTREATPAASIAKLHASEALAETARDAVQLLGGDGFATGGDAERALRDAVGATIYSGTSDIQRELIARWIGL